MMGQCTRFNMVIHGDGGLADVRPSVEQLFCSMHGQWSNDPNESRGLGWVVHRALGE